MRSDLAIYDLATGLVHSLLQTDRLIEAPNWSPCDTHLLVNGDGRLFRVPLDAPALQPIDIPGFHRLNNDHGFSPCGRWIAFTDKTEFGESCIYIVAAAGGAVRRVSDAVPSYWHGWSPDGETLAYVGRRDGIYGICTCPSLGGAEQALSPGFDHADGPDYSADGAEIWFNGERDGAMQIWRMGRDGSAPRQMTDDGRVNWFPHPGPGGAGVLYLSYAPGTRFHPRDCPVELRLIAQKGGNPRILLELFGGQGTINVPCWAPCGTRFAFVRYGSAA